MKNLRKLRNIFIYIILIFIIITNISFVKATIGESLIKNEYIKSIAGEITAKPQEIKNIFSKNTNILNSIASEQDENTYNVQMELNIVNQDEKGVTGGNTLKIEEVTEDENSGAPRLGIHIFNISTGEPIELSENGTFNTQGQGVIVDFSQLAQNNKYQILIEDIESAQGYSKTINSLKLDICIDDQENIIAKISEIEGASGEKLDALTQRLAKLHGVDDEGKVTIGNDKQDPDVNIKYKYGEMIDIEGNANEDNYDIDESGEWEDYNDSITISENSTLYAKAIKNGTESEISLKIINNIDKELPQIDDVNQETISEEDDREAKITAKIKDNASGLVKYGISRSETEEPDTYIMADTNLTEEDISKHRNAHPKLEGNLEIEGICENGIYYIWLWDSAGNHVVQLVEVKNVKEVPVAQIVKTDGADQGLVGQTYNSLYSALEASPENSNTTIKIIAEIYNENNQIKNRNITINLNGYKVNNRSTNEPALTVNEGSSLTILNEAEDESTSIITGSLESENTEAILVKKDGILTIRRK